MLTLDDTVALSVWYRGSRLRMVEQLRRGQPDLTLESVIDAGAATPPPAHLASLLRRRAAAALASARKLGIDAVPFGDARYPALLAPIPDPPLVLWMRGDPSAFDQPSVAIVGSRAATSYGLEAASRLAGDLAAAGALVVSGLARGVDSAAHRGALAAGGTDGGRPRIGCGRRLSARARRVVRGHRRRGRRAERVASRHGAPPLPLPRAKPHHQRALAGRGRGRGGREERVADHGRLRARAGTRRDGGTGQHPLRAAPRVPRLDPGRRRRGRSRPRTSWPNSGAARSARQQHGRARRDRRPTLCWPACSRARATTWSRSGAKPGSRHRNCCRSCWGWSCRARYAGLTGGGSFGPAERVNVGPSRCRNHLSLSSRPPRRRRSPGFSGRTIAWRPASATSATCQKAPTRCLPRSATSPGPTWVSTPRATSSPTTSSRRRRSATSPRFARR